MRVSQIRSQQGESDFHPEVIEAERIDPATGEVLTEPARVTGLDGKTYTRPAPVAQVPRRRPLRVALCTGYTFRHAPDIRPNSTHQETLLPGHRPGRAETPRPVANLACSTSRLRRRGGEGVDPLGSRLNVSSQVVAERCTDEARRTRRLRCPQTFQVPVNAFPLGSCTP